MHSRLARGLVSIFFVLLFLLSSSFTIPTFASTQGFDQSNRIAYPASYDWPSFMYSANHSGAILSPAPLSNKEIAHIKLNGTISSSVALYNGDRKSTRLNSSH